MFVRLNRARHDDSPGTHEMEVRGTHSASSYPWAAVSTGRCDGTAAWTVPEETPA
jgi:hypothetical protein